MKSAPESRDTKECPVDGCQGEYWMEVVGSAVEPVAEYPSTCEHNIESCRGCGEMNHIVEKFSWPVADMRVGSPGKTRVAHFCNECNNSKTIYKTIPTWVFEHGYVPMEVIE